MNSAYLTTIRVTNGMIPSESADASNNVVPIAI
jgi:hypothetical protein